MRTLAGEPSAAVNALVIEDSPTDFLLIRESLAGTHEVKCLIQHATTLSEALEKANIDHYDVILLDLGLPDSDGIDSVLTLKRRCQWTPILVITGHHDESVGLNAIRAGAEDYLRKEELSSQRMGHTVLFTIERARRRERALDQEVRHLGRIVYGSGTPEAAQYVANDTLQSSQPDAFSALMQRYEKILDGCVEASLFKQGESPSAELRNLCDSLGALNAGPRDVMDLHLKALNRKTATATANRAQIYFEQGRLTVIELMGQLVSYYRKRVMQRTPRN